MGAATAARLRGVVPLGVFSGVFLGVLPHSATVALPTIGDVARLAIFI